MIALALCGGGIEKVLSNELRKLNEQFTGKFKILDTGFGRVRFETDLYGIYCALIALRTADRIFLEAGFFPASNFDELFEGAKNICWEDFIHDNKTVVIDKVRCNHSQLASERSVQSVVHKAIADRLCSAYKKDRLPEGGEFETIRVYIEKDTARILLDICGKPLFKRGYRIEGGIAPLRETTASALFFLAGWRRKYQLYDPFCGSGTIPIEAALYAWNIAPGLGRKFVISGLCIADDEIEKNVRRTLSEKIDFSYNVNIFASDNDNNNIENAKANLKRAVAIANVKNDHPLQGIKFWKLDAANAKSNSDYGFVICNPPYGKRLGDTETAEQGYREMSILRNNFPGWKLAVISDHSGFESFFGAKADRCRELTNGAINCFFYEYETELPGKTENLENMNVGGNKPLKNKIPVTTNKTEWTW
ncbi:RNA methyltransferase [Spirochaetia bacterium]|nr:RNA methyltransferase [Spirochaetia bacterium]